MYMVRFKMLEENTTSTSSLYCQVEPNWLSHIFHAFQLSLSFEKHKDRDLSMGFSHLIFYKILLISFALGLSLHTRAFFFLFPQWSWNRNLTQTFFLTSLLRLFLINTVVISKPVVVIIFLLAFFIIFLLQMVHYSYFWLPS